MNDPKQPIFDAMNWLGSTIPGKKPDDTSLIICAYEKVCELQDTNTQKLFAVLIKELRDSNDLIGRISTAWNKSADRLRDACQLIDERK